MSSLSSRAALPWLLATPGEGLGRTKIEICHRAGPIGFEFESVA